MADLIDRESLLEKVQFRIEPKGVIGETVRDMVEKTREIIKAEPAVTDNNDGCKWIPVTERLPDKFGEYIVAVKTREGVVYSDYADYDRFQQRWTTGLYFEIGSTVTNWMPLPEPPMEERK